MSEEAAHPLLTLLVAAPMLYHPHCGNGGGVLCFELLRHLGQRARVHFVGFGSGGADELPALAALRTVAKSVTVVPFPPPGVRGWGSALLQLVSGTPREVRALQGHAMRAALGQVAGRERPDAAILQFPHMAQYTDALGGVPAIIDVQDVCMVSRYREWRASGGGRLRRLLRLHSWWAWARYELNTYGRAQRLMALSEADHGVLRAYLPQVPSFLSPVAWDVAAAPVAGGDGKVLFMGNFAHAPNLDGLRWLLGEVWPQVRRRCPDAALQVAGLNLPPDFASDPQAGVQSLGFVSDVSALLGGAALSLVPYRFGGGIKIKAIEAMAHGCPVVATTVGSEGLGARDGVHLRVADGSAAFADAIVELLAAPALRQALAQQALALVAARFSWEGKMTDLMREIGGLLAEKRRPGSVLHGA